MSHILRFLHSLFAGRYIVSESMPYGHHSFGRHKFLGRFRRLAVAKDYANKMSGELQAKVVVLDGSTNLKLYSFKPQIPNGPEHMPERESRQAPPKTRHRRSRTVSSRRKYARKFPHPSVV